MKLFLVTYSIYFICNYNSVFCQHANNQFYLENDSLTVKVLIKEPIKYKNVASKYWSIKGTITVENKKSVSTKYSNGLTSLKINDRYFAICYVDTYATLIVDTWGIYLNPLEKRTFEVYWKFNEDISKIDKIDLIWTIKKIGL